MASLKSIRGLFTTLLEHQRRPVTGGCRFIHTYDQHLILLLSPDTAKGTTSSPHSVKGVSSCPSTFLSLSSGSPTTLITIAPRGRTPAPGACDSEQAVPPAGVHRTACAVRSLPCFLSIQRGVDDPVGGSPPEQLLYYYQPKPFFHKISIQAGIIKKRQA